MNDRRRFLVGGAAGLTTILVPKVSLACFCCRRRRGYTPLSNGSLVVNCQAKQAFVPPGIPDAGGMKPSIGHQFIVYGFGLVAWYTNGAAFSPIKVVDNNVSTTGAVWGPGSFTGVASDNTGGGAWDSKMTFTASETGSMPNTSGSLSITVTLSGNGCSAIWSWAPQTVTYISS